MKSAEDFKLYFIKNSFFSIILVRTKIIIVRNVSSNKLFFKQIEKTKFIQVLF